MILMLYDDNTVSILRRHLQEVIIPIFTRGVTLRFSIFLDSVR